MPILIAVRWSSPAVGAVVWMGFSTALGYYEIVDDLLTGRVEGGLNLLIPIGLTMILLWLFFWRAVFWPTV